VVIFITFGKTDTTQDYLLPGGQREYFLLWHLLAWAHLYSAPGSCVTYCYTHSGLWVFYDQEVWMGPSAVGITV